MVLIQLATVRLERSKVAPEKLAAKGKMAVRENPVAQAVAVARGKMDVLAELIARVKASSLSSTGGP
jgi:hypothetical protein